MNTDKIENAKIKSTQIGYADLRIITMVVVFMTEHDERRGFGGHKLSGTVGAEFMLNFIRGMLTSVGVGFWEELIGKEVRLRVHNDNVVAVGHVREDIWFELNTY